MTLVLILLVLIFLGVPISFSLGIASLLLFILYKI